MKPARKNRVIASGALLAIIATAAVACSKSPSSSSTPPTSTSTPAGKGGADSALSASQLSSLMKSGVTQANQKNWTGATATFQEVLAAEPSNVYANYNLGVIYQTEGNSNEAIDYYNRALAADATYTPAMYNEAILLETTQPAQAIAVYQKIVSIDPKAATAYLRMALVQSAQGDAGAAKADDAKAVSLDPALSKFKLPAKQ
jgi:tetratricopeptide (TPR) repeat protein